MLSFLFYILTLEGRNHSEGKRRARGRCRGGEQTRQDLTVDVRRGRKKSKGSDFRR